MDITEVVENGFESSLRKILGRCVQCPDKQQLSCPTCSEGKVCVSIQKGCGNCEYWACRPVTQPGISGPTNVPSGSGGGTNIGAIVGGVIGGVVFIAVLTCLVWRFVIKPRRHQWGIESEETYEPYSEKESSSAYVSGGSPGENRGSQFTRQSVASTAYTRGSNVIQIAFIPGITDRSGDDDGLVPPVPPIPIRTASSTPQSPQSPYTDAAEDHYFMPGDLRDSTYSGFTDDAASTFNRQSTAPSIAPSLLRQSVASTVYQTATGVENAVPAQTAQRGRPLMVSVKSSSANSRSPSIPTVPQVDYEKYGQQKPITSPTSPLAASLSVETFKTATDGTPSALSKQTTAQSPSIPAIRVDTSSDSSRPDNPPQIIKRATSTEDEKLKSAIEEATRQASRQPVHGGLGSVRRDPSPFSDDNRLPSP